MDASCAMANGIFQIVTGSLSIILSFAAVNYYAIPTIFLLPRLLLRGWGRLQP